MSCVLCDAVRCIHHDGDGCTLDECELTLTRAMLDDGTPGEIVACSDYVEACADSCDSDQTAFTCSVCGWHCDLMREINYCGGCGRKVRQ